MGHLETLRRDLVHRYGAGILASPDGKPPLPTGYPALDTALGIGGLPRGRIVEMTGDDAGKLTLALGAVAAATRAGGLAAVIDPTRMLYPPAAWAAGVELARLVVVQPVRLHHSLDAIATLLQTEGFELVVYDLPRGAGEPTASQLARLAGAAAHTGTLLLVLSAAPTGRGSAAPAQRPLSYFASVRLLVERRESLWRRDAAGQPLDLAGYRLDVTVVKHKLAAPGASVSVEVAPGEGVAYGQSPHRLPVDSASVKLGAAAEPAGTGEPAADRRRHAG